MDNRIRDRRQPPMITTLKSPITTSPPPYRSYQSISARHNPHIIKMSLSNKHLKTPTTSLPMTKSIKSLSEATAAKEIKTKLKMVRIIKMIKKWNTSTN